MTRVMIFTWFVFISAIMQPLLAAQRDGLRTKTVILDALTKVEINIVPDLGTRFVFPFVLDEHSEAIPFTLKVTNPLFQTKREPGRNYFVVSLPPTDLKANPATGLYPTYLGNMILNAGGFNITVLLKSTNNMQQHYSDVVFEYGDGQRQQLIDDVLAEAITELEQRYAEKEQDLDKRARKLALKMVGELALANADKDNIYEKARLPLTNGDAVELYVDVYQKIGPYHVFTIMVRNDSEGTPVKVQDVQLYATSSQDTPLSLVSSTFSVKNPVDAGQEKGGFVITDIDNFNDYKLFMITALTNNGAISVTF